MSDYVDRLRHARGVIAWACDRVKEDLVDYVDMLAGEQPVGEGFLFMVIADLARRAEEMCEVKDELDALISDLEKAARQPPETRENGNANANA